MQALDYAVIYEKEDLVQILVDRFGANADLLFAEKVVHVRALHFL